MTDGTEGAAATATATPTPAPPAAQTSPAPKKEAPPTPASETPSPRPDPRAAPGPSPPSGPSSPAAPGTPAPPAAGKAARPPAKGEPLRTDKARAVSVTSLSPEDRARAGREVVEHLKEHFLAENLLISERAGITARVKFPADSVLRLCTWLRDEGTFTHCAMVAAIDWRDYREVLYTLWSDHLRSYIELTTVVGAEDPHLESVSGIWPGANCHEREAWDLVGVRFDHHPDLRRILLEEGYKFHPLLKTFELHEPEELEVKSRSGR